MFHHVKGLIGFVQSAANIDDQSRLHCRNPRHGSQNIWKCVRPVSSDDQPSCPFSCNCKVMLCCNNVVSISHWALSRQLQNCLSGFWLVHSGSLVNVVAPPIILFGHCCSCHPKHPQTANKLSPRGWAWQDPRCCTKHARCVCPGHGRDVCPY